MNKIRFFWFALLGLLLLAPACYFMLALSLRVFMGIHGLYERIAPHFLDATWNALTLHRAAWILYGPFLAVALNLALVFRISLQKTAAAREFSIRYRGHWLNAAVGLQGALLLLVLLLYLLIEHLKW